MAKVRGVRFNESEGILIEEFLHNNSFLDFTTLAKIAILQFIKSPTLDLKPVIEMKMNRTHEITHEAN